MKSYKPTEKKKQMIRKYAPDLANALFGEENQEDPKFWKSFEITRSIRMAQNQKDYLGINLIAKAIKDGIGCDLPILIKELSKYVKR